MEKKTPAPIAEVLAQKYNALCTKLGDAVARRDKAQKAIDQIQEEIFSLDSLHQLILVAERNGVERATSDLKREELKAKREDIGKKEKTWHRESEASDG